MIPNRLLASACPGGKDSNEHTISVQKLVNAGIQVVVNTMENEEFKRCIPYQDTMIQHAKEGISIYSTSFVSID